VVTDRILRPRAAPGPSAHASQLKSGSGRPCHARRRPVTMPTKTCTTQAKRPSHIADQGVTLPTKTSIPV